MTPLFLTLLLGLQGSPDLSADFELPAGLEVTLWAESPALHNPAAIDVDERGRIWVAEAVNYRTWDGRNPGLRHAGGDRIVVLEDTDLDGVCDSSRVFVQDPDLVAPLGIAVIAGKVYVSSSPDLFVYEDTDGDGKADTRETLLTGFGGHDHDHGLHAVVAGPDGKLYFTVGNAGPHIVTDKSGWTLRSGSVYRGGGAKPADNKPGLVSDDGRLWTGGLVLRVNYDGTGLEVMAHNFRNNYEVALDSYGEMYVTDNDDDGNGACRTTWVMPGGNYGFFAADGSRTWSADRRPGQDNWAAHWHQDDPGVMPAGARNGPGGPTGCAVYEGELMKRWLDQAVVNADAGARVVYAHFPRVEGAGIELSKTDLLRAKGEEQGARWFRPSDVCVGVDGAVYVSDWWDPGVGGHAAGDQEGYGRILRIAPIGNTPRVPTFDLATTQGRVAALASPAINVRELGRRAIAEGGRDRLAELRPELERRLGTRLGERLYTVMKTLAYAHSEAEPDSGPRFQRQAFAWTKKMDPRGRLTALVREARAFDVDDKVWLELYAGAAEGIEAELYDELVLRLGGQDPLAWSDQLATIVWRLRPAAAIDALRTRALAGALPVEARRQAIDALAFMTSREAAESVLTASQVGPDDLRSYAAWWIRHRDGNDWRAFDLGARVRTAAFDGAELLWKSDVMTTGLVNVDVDVTGAEVVWLVVNDAGNGMSCDWADWIAPRLEGAGESWSLTETAWMSAEAGWGNVQLGRNCSGGPLRVGELTSTDGIGTHANSRIAYAVPDGATRLLAQAGPDVGGIEQGCGTSIQFEVWVTRREAPPAVARWEAVVTDGSLPVGERVDHAVRMASDPEGALRLIRLAERGALDDELRAAAAEAIHRNPDLGVRALASATFPRPGAADYPSIPELAAMIGDVRRGRAVYLDRERAQCITCHAFTNGETTLGGDIGPDLTAIGQKYDDAAMFDAILNPSAAIAHGYDTWLIETTAGRLYSGFVLADGPTVVLKDTQGERHVIDAIDIAERVQQQLSTMPEGVALGITPQELADLVAFLRAPAQETGLFERAIRGRGDRFPPATEDSIALFDGTSLDAWTAHLRDGAELGDVWTIEDGVMVCKGRPIGYIRTKETFTNYHLAVEWRFDPEKGAGNSGVLLRVHGEDKVWPRSIEAQLHSRNAGDIWNIDKFGMEVAPERTSGRRTQRAQPCSEYPLGEWNRYDIWMDGPRLEMYVNGVLQNTADWCEEVPGHIALQSEGAAIEFRSVVLTPLESN